MDRFAEFVAVAALLIVTPGPDTALTVRNALRGSRRGGILTGAVPIGLGVRVAAERA